MSDFAYQDTITISISYVNETSHLGCFVYTKNERTFTRIYTFIKGNGFAVNISSELLF